MGCGAEAALDGDPPPTIVVEPSERSAEFEFEVVQPVLGTTNCPVAEIRFEDRSSGDPERWFWEFSDGSTSLDQNPVVEGAVSEATLSVIWGNQRDSITKRIEIALC